MNKLALFSTDRKYRYALWRIWDEQKPVCMFIGLNPSTADEYADDPTIRRCESFAGSWGYGGLCMANLFALVSTDPNALRGCESLDSGYDDWLVYLAARSGKVVACWGDFSVARDRGEAIRQLIPNLYCLGTTKGGQPKHPLYLSKKTGLERLLK